MTGFAAHLERIVAGVVAATIRDLGAAGVVLLDDGSPEARLLRDWLERAPGVPRLWLATDPASPGPSAQRGDPSIGDVAPELAGAEARRHRARLLAAGNGAVLAHPVNKTALLLGDSPPPEPLLPLGDVYAVDVAAMVGDWSAPAAVRALAERAGGIAALDALLAAMLGESRGGGRADGTDARAPVGAPEAVAADVRARLAAGRHWRRHPRIVPKIGTRTVGIDLFG